MKLLGMICLLILSMYMTAYPKGPEEPKAFVVPVAQMAQDFNRYFMLKEKGVLNYDELKALVAGYIMTLSDKENAILAQQKNKLDETKAEEDKKYKESK